MKKNKPIYFLLILILTLDISSCCSSREAAKSEITQKNVKILLEPTVDRNFKIPDKQLTYKIKNASITDSILTIRLSYTGGCEEHSFDLKFNGMYMKSLPRKGSLYLYHDNKNDKCEELIELKLQYNLSNIIGSSKQATNYTLYGWDKKLSYSLKE